MNSELDKNNGKTRREPKSDVYGVIGICGIVGNLIARMLMDRGCRVIGTDLKREEECEFKYTFENYSAPLYFSDHPESFFKESNYIITPPSLPENSKLFMKIMENGKDILGVEDCLKIFKPEKPVLCITGTNGKTTTTTILKHVCSSAGLKPTEHGFKKLQGNIDYIPPIQARLNGDVAVLETGTFGKTGDLKLMVERSIPDCGLLTNINPDHLDKNHDFMSYALIKGEFVEYFKKKTLIINSDDPTVFGLVCPENHPGDLITFGVDSDTAGTSFKACWCGREIRVDETISGSGYYRCECGLERPRPDYLATEIDAVNGKFKLKTSDIIVDVQMKLIGLHNVYNVLGAIAAGIEFFKIPIDEVVNAIGSFEGVPGRIEYMYSHNGMDVFIDYGHNPAGIETVLREFKKVYSKITAVITVSSESGESGDIEILEKALEIGDFIVPASYASRMAATKQLEHISSGKIILTDIQPEKFREGTLGASLDQVLEGLKKGLKCDTNAVVCFGEAAFKYKEDIVKLGKNINK